jgi:hypothetical protein
MSLQRTFVATCPFCGFQQSTIIWDTINGTDNPELKKDLLAHNVNHINCYRCRRGIELAVNLLYHDMNNRYMVWLRYPEDHSESPPIDPEINLLTPLYSDYKLRIVTSRNQQAEKIRIFDNNLDDRSVEISKIIMIDKFDYKNFPTEDRIIFNKLYKALFRSSELLFWIVDLSFKKAQNIYLKYSIYLEINDKVQKYFTHDSDHKPEWLHVNRDYAAKLATKILSNESNKKQESSKPSKPDGTVQWQDDSGRTHEYKLQQNELQDFLKKSDAKQVFRILIKDPVSNNILEDYWQLTSEQVNNFVDENSTAYCIVTYTKEGERKQYLVNKEEWIKIPKYNL